MNVFALMTENLAMKRELQREDPTETSRVIIERAYEDAKLLAADHLAGALTVGRQRALDNPPRLLTRLPASRTPKRYYPRW